MKKIGIIFLAIAAFAVIASTYISHSTHQLLIERLNRQNGLKRVGDWAVEYCAKQGKQGVKLEEVSQQDLPYLPIFFLPQTHAFESADMAQSVNNVLRYGRYRLSPNFETGIIAFERPDSTQDNCIFSYFKAQGVKMAPKDTLASYANEAGLLHQENWGSHTARP